MVAAVMLASSLFADAPVTDASVRELIEQNRRLEAQVRDQQAVIDKLHAEMKTVQTTSERHDRELQKLQETVDAPQPAIAAPAHENATLRLSGELELAWFRTGSAGSYPNSEFRVGDAKLFLEAKVWQDVYAFSEIYLMTRETNVEAVQLGELYVDFENVSGRWGADQLLNVRVGRFNIPFGEEYQVRSVLLNPLISHSLTDLWGVDEGMEVFGASGKLSYVLAVQNGGHSLLHDYDADKSWTARLGYDPTSWLHLSASAMRTGALAKGDVLSEVWFANGFFRALGSPTTTNTFHADLYELDAATHWKSGKLAVAAGWVKFNDDDTTANNSRTMNYHLIEGTQQITEKLFAAARYSAIRVPRGYPLVGWGAFGTYFYSGVLTEKLERLSVGLGYRMGPPLVLKFEYSIERGRLTIGRDRDHEDFIGTEVGLKF
jgi:hypothetical protein